MPIMKPWLLLWEAENTIDTVPDITSEAIDLRFIDTFPIIQNL